MRRKTLECHDIVLRAVLRSQNIDRENNRVLAQAFLLRTSRDGTKEETVSVSYDCSPAVCAAGFDKCYGVASLHVGRVRNLGLDVVPDEPHHASIVGLPHPNDDPAKAEHMASLLRAQARLVWHK